MRIQCISLLLSTPSRPTTGMLFSDWHATTHAPHPVHVLRSITIAHRSAPNPFVLGGGGSYRVSGRRFRVGAAGVAAFACDADGLDGGVAAEVTPSMSAPRPSSDQCSCVIARSRCAPVRVTMTSASANGAADVRIRFAFAPTPRATASDPLLPYPSARLTASLA